METLPEDTVLSCRQVSREAKKWMDNILFDYRSDGGSMKDYIFRFYREEDYQKLFSRGSSMFTRNPFHLRQFIVSYSEPENVPRVLELLRRYGHQIYDAVFYVSVDPDSRNRQTEPELEPVLANLPNVQSLLLEAYHPNQQIMANYGPNAPPLAQPIFPKLPYLKSLGFASLGIFDGQEERRALILALLKSYGAQLSTFKCDSLLFFSELRIDLVSSLLPNLTALEIEADAYQDFLIWRRLVQFNLPLLKRLTLKPYRALNELIRLDTLTFTGWFLQALQNFRSSLQELHLIKECALGPDFDFANLELDFPGVLEPFEKLTKLRILTENMLTPTNSGIWSLLAKLFPNLQVILFKKRQDDMTPRPPSTEFG